MSSKNGMLENYESKILNQNPAGVTLRNNYEIVISTNPPPFI